MEQITDKMLCDAYGEFYNGLRVIVGSVKRHGFTENVKDMLNCLLKEIEDTYLFISDEYEQKQEFQKNEE